MQGVGAIDGGARASNNLNAPGGFRGGLKQFIDVAKAGGTKGNAVLRHDKSAAATRAGQYRRADCGQMFLAVAAADPDAGQPLQRFIDVRVADQSKGVVVYHPDTGHGFSQCLLGFGGGDDDFIQTRCTGVLAGQQQGKQDGDQ